MKQLIKIFAVLFAILFGLLIFGLIWLRSSSSDGYVGEETELSKYEERIQSADSHPTLQHFPRDIPTNAAHVSYYYRPRLGQGGSAFQLRYVLPAEELENVRDMHVSEATFVFLGSSSNPPIPPPSLFAGHESGVRFPESYEIIVLGAEALGKEGHEWNHGFSYGVAVDVGSSEIVYWQEDW